MTPFDPRQSMKLMFYTIVIILLCTYAFADNHNLDLNKKVLLR